jgi:hypothetical protein
MKKLKNLTVLLLSFVALIPFPGIAEPADGNSTIVFLRSSFVGGGIKASLYEVTNGETKFIGIMKNKSQIRYDTTMGKHTFMVVSEAADFMEANIVDGKTYYSLVIPRTGAWKARFSLYPIRNDGTSKYNTDHKKFNKWLTKTKLVEMTDKSTAWYEKHKENIEGKRIKYWETWLEKSAEALAKRTLNPDDGIATIQ